MSIKGLLKLAVVVALLFTGVQFAKVYVHQLQLKKAIGDEALDARRSGPTNADSLKSAIRSRAQSDGSPLPEFTAFEVTGLGDPKADIVVTAEYTEIVDLMVRKIPVHRVVTARADAPGN